MNLPIGTLINVVTVLGGTLIGGLLGNRLPERMRQTAVVATGLITLMLGMKMGLSSHNVLITLGCLVVGGSLGEWWRINALLEALGRWVEAKVTRQPVAQSTPEHGDPAGPTQRSIARAFVTASLIFCIGPITVLGAINDSSGDFQLLAIKALLDGITAIALASSLGWGVGISAATVLIIQGTITIVSSLIGHQATLLLSGQTVLAGQQLVPLGQAMLDEMTAVGGMIIVGLGLLLLDLRQIRIANFLPALALAPLLVLFLHWLGVPVAP